MCYEVDYYRTARGDMPVKEFLDSLPAKLKAKNMREIGLLEEFGTDVPDRYIKPLHGSAYKGLWELRIKFSSDITRIFYFSPSGKRILLLHGFIKKSERTPETDKQLALSRMKDAISRGL